MQVSSWENRQINLDVLLNEIYLFKSLTDSQRENVKKNIKILVLERSEILISKGDVSEYVYIVYEGRLAVCLDEKNWQSTLQAIIHHGELIGEIGLITNEKRAVSIIAVRESLVLQIPNSVIKDIMLNDPNIMLSLMHVLAKRFRNLFDFQLTKKPLDKKMQIFAFITSNDKEAARVFLCNFVNYLKKYKKVIILTQDTSIDFKDINAADYNHIKNRSDLTPSILFDLENKYDLILLDCGYEVTTWSLSCIEKADAFLFVANSKKSSDLSPFEKFFFDNKQKFSGFYKRMILLHDSKNILPKETSTWMLPREEMHVSHINLDNENTLHRLARIISNNCISLTLSGGGVSGYAHIGVLKAFEEYGINIDSICGVSSGSIIACLYAMGYDHNKIAEIIISSAYKAKKEKFFYLQLPLCSLMKPHVFFDFFREIIGDIYIEDLWLPFFCVASNLHKNIDIVFDKGPLLRAITASNSLPGMMSPTLIDGEMYIDGGASNTMPGDIMKDRMGGIAIAVDVTKEMSLDIDPSLKAFPSTVDILIRKFNPFKKNLEVPLINSIISSAIVVGNKRKLNEVKQIVDYVIEPNVDYSSALNIKNIDKTIEIGYQAAIKELSVWGNDILHLSNKENSPSEDNNKK